MLGEKTRNFKEHTTICLDDLVPGDNFYRDLFTCPQGQEIPLWSRRKSELNYVYRADQDICNACPVKSQCTVSKSGRHLYRSFFQDYLDRAANHRETEAYKKAIRKRQVWVEPLFGEGKQWHGMGRFRLRGLEKVNIEGLMIAAGQNVKRLLKARPWQQRPTPAAPAAVQLLRPPEFLFNFSVCRFFRVFST